MKTEKTYNIDEIIVAHTMINTDIYIETTNNRGTITFFQNLNKNLECNNKKYITILRDINNEKYLYVDRFNNISYDSEDLIYQITPWYIETSINLKNLIPKFYNDQRQNSQYRNYITKQVKKLQIKLKNKETLTKAKLENILNEVTEIYAYVFEIITDKEYEELVQEDEKETPKVIDIESYKVRKK